MVKEGTTVQTMARGNGGRSQHNSGECCTICYVGMYESLWAPTKERRGDGSRVVRTIGIHIHTSNNGVTCCLLNERLSSTNDISAIYGVIDREVITDIADSDVSYLGVGCRHSRVFREG